jgi:hypothetical protein
MPDWSPERLAEMAEIRDAKGDTREPILFDLACLMLELVREGTLGRKAGLAILESACRENRLLYEDPDAYWRAIASAFLTLETEAKLPN